MPVLIHDEDISDALIADRQATGLDRYDEVWNGVYVVSPLANVEHQDLVMALSGAIMMAWDLKGLGRTQPGANVSDRRTGWTSNYRIPDVLCFSSKSPALDCDTHWCGGPEFAIEITSRGDRMIEKLDFYALVGTQEVLVLDRNPWKLSLYRVEDDGKSMSEFAVSDPTSTGWVQSRIVPVRFRLDFPASLLRIEESSGRVLREIAFETVRTK